MSSMYRENIVDHFKNPTHKGELTDYTIKFHDSNPLCGDDITVFVSVDENNVVREARFIGEGCAISLASADMLMESIEGMKLEDVMNLSQDDIKALLGIPLTPVRLKCAILGLKVLQAGVTLHLKEKEKESSK